MEKGGDTNMRKDYSKPELKSEVIEVGVYGDYGGDGGQGGGPWGSFIGIFNPLMGMCCGGGN